MPSPDFLTYDGDVANGINPYRPGIDDVGGGQKLNDQNEPPDPITMLDARDFNEMSFLLVAHGKVTPAAIVLVTNAGTPAIAGVRAAGSQIVSADFTVIHHATGDVEITCPQTKIIPPWAAFGFSQAIGDWRVSGRINATNDGIRLETRNSAGTLADVNFVAFWL